MTRLVLLLAFAAALFWSLVAWGAWAFVDWFAGFAAGDAQPWLPPELAPLLATLGSLFAAAGFAGVIVVWLLGLAAILAAALFGLWVGGVMRTRPLHQLPPDRWIGRNERPSADPGKRLARVGLALLRGLLQRR